MYGAAPVRFDVLEPARHMRTGTRRVDQHMVYRIDMAGHPLEVPAVVLQCLVDRKPADAVARPEQGAEVTGGPCGADMEDRRRRGKLARDRAGEIRDIATGRPDTAVSAGLREARTMVADREHRNLRECGQEAVEPDPVQAGKRQRVWHREDSGDIETQDAQCRRAERLIARAG